MMPLYAVICRDKPGRVETRAATRPAHLDWLAAHGGVQFAGPLIEDGAPIGSLVVIEAGDLAAAKAWVATDPYAAADVFAAVEVIEWKKAIG
ncbi:YciI family protein [Paracoccus sp. SJTW-4]|uniref:YciI family protein n=1 Tax=Paracoccus sp. SJTW-4 TaxID=3078428 RepID=UPI0039E96071